jgi:hypothetical protein
MFVAGVDAGAGDVFEKRIRFFASPDCWARAVEATNKQASIGKMRMAKSRVSTAVMQALG